jgi:hypothetical protein
MGCVLPEESRVVQNCEEDDKCQSNTYTNDEGSAINIALFIGWGYLLAHACLIF